MTDHAPCVEQAEALAFANLTANEVMDAVDQCLEPSGRRCDGRFQALNSYENRVYLLHLDNNDAVVAKFYRPGRWSDEQIIEEHDLLAELDDAEIGVIAPLRVEDRALFHSDNHRFALYPRIMGQAPQLDSFTHIEQMGRLLGRLHGMLGRRRYQHRLDLTPQRLVQDASAKILLNNWLPPHVQDDYQRVLEQLQQAITTCYAAAALGDLQALHGDCHPGNILFTAEQPCLLDFDDATNGPAIQDLWMLLSGERAEMTQQMGYLLDGYQMFNELNLAQLHLIEALRAMRMVYFSAWLADRWHEDGFRQGFPWFNTEAYWRDHVEDLQRQIELMNEPPLRVS